MSAPAPFPAGAVALVTGAATGIGLATAQAFAQAGCRVVLSDRDRARGEQAAAQIRTYGDAQFIACDVADPDQVAALHRDILARQGRLDIACNNAGVEGEPAPTGDCSLDNFDRVLDINLRGLFLCLREQMKIMSQAGHGAVVNIASVAGLIGFAGLPAYCASKGGVVQLTRTAALEYATAGVRVNAICPGAIRTEMIDRVTRRDPAGEAAMVALHPMNRMGNAQEVADAAVYLCSARASFITGQALAVDGGFTAR
ncbi:MAG: glucose 1-dehydrogenase [Pseudomonadota bacterium]